MVMDQTEGGQEEQSVTYSIDKRGKLSYIFSLAAGLI